MKFFRSELDSELLDDRSTVLGVLTADEKGLCLLGKPWLVRCQDVEAGP